MAIAIARRDLTAAALRGEAGRTRDARAVRRMLAPALAGADRATPARACGMDRQTLRDWVHRYNAEGLRGLVSRRAPPRPRKLTAEQMAELADWVEAGLDPEPDGVARWRRKDLQRRIETAFAA